MTVRGAERQVAIRNGEATFDHPAVGMLSAGGDFCAATLIGCETVVTAAHCVCPDLASNSAACIVLGIADPANTGVFFQHAGLVRARSITIDPSFLMAVSGDVAVIKLARPITGIAPMPINRSRRPGPGTNATIVGFGPIGGGTVPPGVGIKRSAAVETNRCPDAIPSSGFDCVAATSSDDPTICQGDSGGPLLIDMNEEVVIGGIASGLRGGPGILACQPPMTAYYSDAFVSRDFIEDNLAPDGDAPCGTLPVVGGPGMEAHNFIGVLAADSPELRESFDVPVGTDLLRVMMNGVLATDAGRNNFDLFIREGSPPSTTESSCSDTGAAAIGSCEISAPRPGRWYVLARHLAGAGQVQITASLFDDPTLQAPTNTPTATATSTATSTRAPTWTPRPPLAMCVGDCDTSGTLTVAEVVRGVSIALDRALLSECPSFDTNADGRVSINELLQAVGGILYGCLSR